MDMTKAQFLDYLQRSELLRPERLAAVRAEADKLSDDDAEALGARLIEAGVLTPFQVERLLRGKWRNFIVNEKFLVLDRWDAGNLGVFFRCEHMGLRKRVVLRSHAALSDDPEHDVKGLLERLRALSQVLDPHLARVIDTERVGQQLLLVMEDLEPVSAEERAAQEGPLPLEQACSVSLQAALGLATLHEAEWIHGEVRPARIYFDPAGMVKLLDAGLGPWLGSARHGSRGKFRGGEEGFPLWDYTAPESLALEPHVDQRSDLYALGCSLYHLLTGRPPFADLGPAEKVEAHRRFEPPTLREVGVAVPEPIQRLLDSLLAKHPDDRPAAASEVIEALLPWTGEQLPPATQAMLGLGAESGDAAGAETEAPPRRQTPSHARAHKRRITTLLAGALALVSIGICALALFATLGSMTIDERLQAIRQALADRDVPRAARLFSDGLSAAPPAAQSPAPTSASGAAPVAAAPVAAARAALIGFLNQNQNEDFVRAVAARMPNDADVQLRLGDLDAARKNWAQAADAYARATTIDARRPEAWEKLTGAEVRRGNWVQAADHHARLLGLRNNEAVLWVQQAILLARAGRTADYQAFLERMWNRFKDSNNPEVIAQLGFAAAAAGAPLPQTPELLAKVELAANRLPNLGWPRFAQAALLYRQGKFDQAAQLLKQIYDGNRAWTARQLCLPLLSLAQLRLNQRAQAEKTFREVDEWQRGERRRLGVEAFVPITNVWWDWVLFDVLLNEARPAATGRGAP
jgi:tetratricopeptide (TPR) repeat protein